MPGVQVQGALLLSYLEVIDPTYTWHGVEEPDLIED